MRVRRVLAIGLIVVILVGSGCGAISSSVSDFNGQISSIIYPYTFDFASWELKTLVSALKRNTTSLRVDAADCQSVIKYFSYVRQLGDLDSEIQVLLARRNVAEVAPVEGQVDEISTEIAALKPVVERTIALQIGQTLAEQGIYNPLGNTWFTLPFPPVYFSLENPLYELIISRRDKIERVKSITLNSEITASEMQEIESSIDDLDVSSLVVEIGGLGATYPTFVVNNADLRWTIGTAAHEWVHQYLAFKPLGFRYILDLLGLSRDYGIGTVNETVANMFGQEIGAIVYNKYYAQIQPSDPGQGTSVPPGFDFNAAMRSIRKNVDIYLALGQVDQAEKYMDEQQQYLASQGNYIRKLNQAYFAFYGTYADGPNSIDPIGSKLRLIRNNSLSLKEFLNTVSTFGSSQDLSRGR